MEPRTPPNVLLALGVLSLLTIAFAGCTEPQEEGFDTSTLVDCDLTGPGPHAPRVVFDTNMGSMVAELYLEQAPVTVENFLGYVESGAYDDTLSHRVVEGFMVQLGNLNTKGRSISEHPFAESRDLSPIQDEFHHALRHDAPGTLSMANSGPNTGTSQFFITFDDTSQLDDRHAVFGRVIHGLDVLRTIDDRAGVTGQEDGAGTAPHAEVRLESVRLLCDPEAPAATTGASVWAYDDTQPVHPDGGSTQFLVVVESEGNRIQELTLSVPEVSGANATIEAGFETLSLPAGQRAAVIVHVDAEAGSDLEIPVTVALDGATLDTVTLTVERVETGAAVVEGDNVDAHYIGVMPDGRVFDTSVQNVADKVRDDDLGYSTFQHRGAYRSFSFTPGGGVIQGFTDLAVGTPEGGSAVGRIPPADAYGESGRSPLAGRTLLFQLDVLSID